MRRELTSRIAARGLAGCKPAFPAVRFLDCPPSLKARHATLWLVLLALAPCSFAQHSAGGHAAAPSHAGIPRFAPPTNAFARAGHSSRGPRRADRNSLPFPFFADFLGSGDVYSTGYPVASEPPAYLLEAARGLGGIRPETAAPASPNAPLMIELQGNRYVKVSSAPIDGEALPLVPSSTGSHPPVPQAAAPLPPVTLIYRDGHNEQVRDYTIANNTLYARGDLYTEGYWSKNIDLADLDLPQTLQANARRNVKFDLPASANEVIARF